MRSLLVDIITNPVIMAAWVLSVLIAETILIRDLQNENNHLKPLMKVVWGLTVLYSSFVGLAIYYYAGRKEIPEDNIWRKGFRSVAHCYSGCGAGEVTGLIIAVGLLNLNQIPVVIITFSMAYLVGYAMTVGPLVQSGMAFDEALKDAFYSETASIAVMEIVAIGTDIWLAGDATMGEPLFWSALVVSLTMGLIAAYPVNLILINMGVKEGMHNPKEHASATA